MQLQTVCCNSIEVTARGYKSDSTIETKGTEISCCKASLGNSGNMHIYISLHNILYNVCTCIGQVATLATFVHIVTIETINTL